jgi:hypothetical protein
MIHGAVPADAFVFLPLKSGHYTDTYAGFTDTKGC